MKRITVLLGTAALCLCLSGCGAMDPYGHGPQSSPAPIPDVAAETAVPQGMEWVGPWHLDSEKNDLAAFADALDVFPGYGEWGASMEIRSNGQMSWYIGAEGWHGTYTVEDGVIRAQMTSDLDQSARLWEFRLIAENGSAVLEMKDADRTIYWAYGDREDAAHGGNGE